MNFEMAVLTIERLITNSLPLFLVLKFRIFFLVTFLIGLISISGSQKPNIIIFMADDMGIGDTSAYLKIKLMEGTKPISKTVKTPNIDKFAKKGMIFTDAHAPASSAAPHDILCLRVGLPIAPTSKNKVGFLTVQIAQ